MVQFFMFSWIRKLYSHCDDYNIMACSLVDISLSPSFQDGFHEVVETLLNKQRRRLREQERARTQADNDSPTFWQNTATVGAVAVGAAVLLGLRQAFSWYSLFKKSYFLFYYVYLWKIMSIKPFSYGSFMTLIFLFFCLSLNHSCFIFFVCWDWYPQLG